MKAFGRLSALVCGILFTLTAFAAGVIETASGQVRAGSSAAAATAAKVGQRIVAGTTLSTGPKSRAVVRFDDGQAIVLHENSEFRVTEYAFEKEQPAKDRFGFDLIRGAIRSVTASLTRRNPKAFTLHAGTATMGIRGTDFMVAIVNPVYLRVLNGAIEVVTTGGAATFGAGIAATIADASTIAITIPLSQLPPPIAAAFNELAGLVVVVDSATLGATLATSGAEGSLTLPAALGIAGAIAAGIAAAAAQGGNGAQGTTTGLSGPTGTR